MRRWFAEFLPRAAASPGPRLSPVYAYALVVGVYVLIFGDGIVTGLGVWAHWAGWHGRWVADLTDVWGVNTLALVDTLIVVWLIIAAIPGGNRARAAVRGAVGAGGIALAVWLGQQPWLAFPTTRAATVAYMIDTALTVGLVHVLIRRAGLSWRHLDPGTTPGTRRRGAGTRIYAASMLGTLALLLAGDAGAGVGSGLGVRIRGIGDIGYWTVRIVRTSIIEEVIVVAVLVTVLEAAGRRRREILAVGIAARVLYHLYLYQGLSVLSPALFGALQLWLYHRTRRLWPLVAAHMAADALSGLLLPAAFHTTPVSIGVTLAVVAVIGHAADTLTRPTPTPATTPTATVDSPAARP